MKFLIGIILSVMLSLQANWAEKTLQTMTSDEKIGQLFMIAAYVDRDYAEREVGNIRIIEEVEHLIASYHVGGLGFVGPSLAPEQVTLTNYYQQVSQIPLLIAQDFEWGLVMRMKDGLRFPKNSALGFVNDTSLIYNMGKEIGRQMKLIGVHMNLSPVLDVNIEPENIAINVRSFGSSPLLVAEKGVAMIRGLQDAGVIASAKHFPGLGDITVDPHLGLPISQHSRKRLDQVEFFPFLKAIHVGVMSIQTEHLLLPALDAENPASLSPVIVGQILKQELGFQGLVLSGALRMKALTERWSDEEIAVKAFLAGSDMLLMPHDLPKAFAALKTALHEGKITQQQIDERVLKILKLKEQIGLHQSRVVAVPTPGQLKTPEAKALKAKLYKAATQLMRDQHHLVPISPQEKVAYVQLGEAPSSEYLEALRKQLKVDVCQGEKLQVGELDRYHRIILAVYPADPRRIKHIRLESEQLKNFRVHGLSASWISLLKDLQWYADKTVVALFGNPFGLPFFEGYPSLILAQEPDPDAQEAAAELMVQTDSHGKRE